MIRLSGLCVPHLCTHSWKITNTQKCITCINIFIPKPLLTHYWPNYWLFSFKYPYIYALYVFSCLFNTCTREWSKLVIRTTKGENSYHLCFWYQWPFGASRSWFQIFITISKLIQLIIYNKTSNRFAYEVLKKNNIQEKFPQNRFFLCLDQKSFVWHSSHFFLMHSFSHQNTTYCKFN